MASDVNLTEKQLAFILHASHGKTAKETAEVEGCSAGYVAQQLMVARQVVGAFNTTDLVAMALRNRWIK